MKTIPIKVIEEQFRLNEGSARVIKKGSGFLLLQIDCSTKRGDVDGYGSCDDIPFITISINEDSMHYNTNTTKDTELSFPTLKGWHLQMAEVSRYTLSVLLIKED